MPNLANVRSSRPSRRGRNRGVAIAAAALGAMSAARAAQAATQIWDPAQTGASGGTGTWDTTDPFWDTGTSATKSQTWVNGNTAYFNGVSGTVTLTSGIGASGLTFQTSGYILNSDASGDPLTLNGSTPTINYQPSPSAGTLTLNAVLTGTAGLVLNATSVSSTIAVNGANTFTGVAEFVQDTVNFSSLANGGTASAVGAGSDNVYVGGSVTSASGSNTQANYVGTGVASTNRLWAITGTSVSDAINNNSANASGGALNFTNTGVAVAGVVGPRSINLGGTYNASANTLAESITDLGTGANITSLKVSGDRWILSGTSSTYTGVTNITSGSLSGIGGSAFGNTSGINVGGSGTLGLLGDASTAFNSSSTNTPYNVTTTATNATINVDQASSAGTSVVKTMTIGNISTSSAAASITFNFTGANNTSLGVGTVSGPTTLTAAGAVTIANAIPTAVGGLTVAGYTSGNTFGESLTIGGVGNTTVTGPITPAAGTLTLTKSGAATLSLLGSSTYTGGTNIGAGTVSLGLGTSVGTGPVNFTASSSLTVSAGLTLSNAITVASGVTASFKDGVVTTTGGTPSALFQVAGVISGLGNVMLGSQSNSLLGPIELANTANTFTGTFTAGYGFYEYASVANAGVASSLGEGSTITLGNSSSYETFQYVGSGSSTTTRAINWTGTTGNLALDSSGTGTVAYNASAAIRSGVGIDTLVLQGTNTGANTLAQLINDSTSGATGVTKAGAGKWVLTAANTYTGPTTITAGTLVANNATNSLGAGSTTTVSGNGVLAGTGNTGTGAVVINSGGTITAGTGATASDTPGTLTTAAQTWNSSGGYVAKLTTNGTITADNLVMSGLTVAALGGTPFLVTAYGSGVTLSGGTQVLIASDSNTSSPSATFNPFANAIANNLILVNNPSSTVNVPSGETLSLVAGSDASGGFELYLTDTSATPEPTSLMLAVAAATPLVLGRRRRVARAG